MITVEQTYDFDNKAQVFKVIVPDKDMVSIDLDAMDRAVLAEPAKNAADVLQSLQILAFRQQQQVKEKRG